MPPWGEHFAFPMEAKVIFFASLEDRRAIPEAHLALVLGRGVLNHLVAGTDDLRRFLHLSSPMDEKSIIFDCKPRVSKALSGTIKLEYCCTQT